MALLFMDGFDHYSEILYGSMKWDNTLSVNCTYYPTYGRRGGGMIALVGTTGTYPEYLYKTLNGNHATIMVGFAVTFQHSTPPPTQAQSFLKLCDGSTDHIYLRLNVTTRYLEVVRAPSTILGTYSVPLSDGVWYYIELKATISDTVGSIQLRINEYLALNLSNQDTQNGANPYINKIAIAGWTPTSYRHCGANFDDLYICDDSGASNNDFLGDCRIDVIRPNGAGYTTNWAPSAGSNYQCVDDALFDNGTDYVSETTVGDIDSYTFSDLPVGIADIKGIQTNVFAARTDSGVNTKLKPFLRPVSTNYEKTEATLTISYRDYNEITELNPETGLAWTKSTVDAMEAGIELTENPI